MTPTSDHRPAEPGTDAGSTVTGKADTIHTPPRHDPPRDVELLASPDITLLDDKAAWRLLAPVKDNPAKVWAYASAVTAPEAAPVDEVLLTETRGFDLSVVWVRHPGSYTGTSGHLLGGTGDHQVTLLRCWERWVFELADLVEAHGDQTSPIQWPARYAYMQTDYLRWTACYGVTNALSGLARDNIRQTIRDHPDGGLAHDLGDLPPDGAAQIAAGADHGPATLIPPGWDLHGWDATRPRTHPILAGLQPAPPRPPQGTAR